MSVNSTGSGSAPDGGAWFKAWLIGWVCFYSLYPVYLWFHMSGQPVVATVVSMTMRGGFILWCVWALLAYIQRHGSTTS